MNNYKTPESSPKKVATSPPKPPVNTDLQFVNPPNNLGRLAIPQNLNQRVENPQEGGANRPNLRPRNNQNNQPRLG